MSKLTVTLLRITTLSILTVLCASAAFAAGRRHAVTNDVCRTAVSPSTVSFPTSGGLVVVSVSTTGACPIAPLETADWLTATNAAGGVTIQAAANSSGAPRTAIVHIRSAVVVVVQAYENPNLLLNASFADNLANWSETYSTGSGSARWVMDVPNLLGAPPVNRGVAALTSNQAGAGYQLNQCVAVSPNTTYDAGVSFFIPSGQSHGLVVFGLYPYDNPTCQGGYLATYRDNRDAPIGSWFNSTLSVTTDRRMLGMLVVIGAGGSTAPPFTTYFDDVFIRPRK